MGKIEYQGGIDMGYNLFQKNIQNELRTSFNIPINAELDTLQAYITNIELVNNSGHNLANDEALTFKINIKSNKGIKDYRIGMAIKNADNKPVGLLFSKEKINIKEAEQLNVVLKLNNHNLSKGVYFFDFSIGIGNEESAIMDSHVVYEALILEITKKHFNSETKITNWNKLNWGDNNYNDFSLEINS